VICDFGARTRKAQLIVGTGNENFLIYRYAYERDTVAKKWRKIKLSGENTVGSWITGSAAAELSYVPKKGVGEVLVYTCEQTNGIWRCGCKDTTCASPAWQIQKYSDISTKKVALTTQKPQEETLDGSYLSVHGFSSRRMKKGDVVAVYGKGFTQDMRVHFDENNTVTARVIDTTTAEFTMPTIEPGVYKAWLTQERSRSRNIVFNVVSDNSQPVRIDSISPSVLYNNTNITIQGTGFTPEGNLVYLGTFAFHDIPSRDGKTITFNIKPQKISENDIPQEARAYLSDAMIQGILDLDKIPTNGKEFPMAVQILNGNGHSNTFLTSFK
jgi:hypothetical protein